jgi:hypothetical protein
MINVPDWFVNAEFRCQGRYTVFYDAVKDSESVKLHISDSTFPPLPFYLRMPSRLELVGLHMSDGGASAAVLADDQLIPELTVFVNEAPGGTLAGSTVGLSFAEPAYPFADWGTRLFYFAGTDQKGTFFGAGLLDPGLPSGLPTLSFEPVNWDCLIPNTFNDLKYQGIVPLGALNPSSGHVFPTSHHLMMVREGLPLGVTGDIYAPCDGLIHFLSHRIILSPKNGIQGPPFAAYHDFDFHLAGTTEYDVTFGHVHSLSSVVFRDDDIAGLAYDFDSGDVPVSYQKFVAGDIPGLPNPLWQGYELLDSGDEALFRKEVPLARAVSPGQHLGQVGAYSLFNAGAAPQRGFDFGGVNYTKANLFLSSDYYAEYDERTLFAESPLERIGTRQLLAQVTKRLWRVQDSVHPPFGQVCFDMAGTLSGNWFRLGAQGEARAYPENQLAFVYDVLHPKRPLISIGDSSLWLWQLKPDDLMWPDDGVYRVSGTAPLRELWHTSVELLSESLPLKLELAAFRTQQIPASQVMKGTILMAHSSTSESLVLKLQMIPEVFPEQPLGFLAEGEFNASKVRHYVR